MHAMIRTGRAACAAAFASATLLLGCDHPAPTPGPEVTHAPTAPVGSGSATAPGPSPAAPSIDPAVIAAATGGKPEAAEGVVKVSFPRDDVKVEVDGWALPPFQGVTSWVGFVPGEKPGVEAMAMGDLVLFPDEVDGVMAALFAGGMQVTALHNHFFFDKPQVFFMHVEGEGKAEALGKTVKSALDAARAVRARSPQPQAHFDGPPLPAKSALDAAKLEAALGIKGAARDGMYKITVGRPAAQAACGCKIGKMMGVNTWAGFAGTDESAIVDGDFAVTEDELQPVLRALTGGGIHVVAIHHHMVGEQPRILFVHYWGRGPAAGLAATVKGALALTKTAG